MNLAAPSPLTAAEKKIAPASRTILIGVETFIQGRIGEMTTPAARTSFWNSLCGYATRNHEGSTSAAAPATRKAATTATRSKTAAKTKTRGAGSAA
jgi:hypothetical protein